jgi:hypothetical protein
VFRQEDIFKRNGGRDKMQETSESESSENARIESTMQVETVKEEVEAIDEEVEMAGKVITKVERSAKVVKWDDAEIPMYLWDK